jgi:hypothetical protein
MLEVGGTWGELTSPFLNSIFVNNFHLFLTSFYKNALLGGIIKRKWPLFTFWGCKKCKNNFHFFVRNKNKQNEWPRQNNWNYWGQLPPSKWHFNFRLPRQIMNFFKFIIYAKFYSAFWKLIENLNEFSNFCSQ